MFRVNNNIASLNAQRHLNNTGEMTTKSIERLSSGLRINKAADDAAAMFVSEQMRSQITAYKQANRNVAQATTLLQVMEGGLDQLTGILTRLKELAMQAADGAYSDAQRQKGIQVEGDQLIEEINRIVTGVRFNGITLFPLMPSSVTFAVGELDQDRLNLALSPFNKDTLLGDYATKIGVVQSATTLTGGSTFALDATTGALSATGSTLLTELTAGEFLRIDGRQFRVTDVTDDENAEVSTVLEGTLSTIAGSTIVRGYGTKFAEQLKNGDTITISGTSYVIASVDSNTQITLGTPPTASETVNGSASVTGFVAPVTAMSAEKVTPAGQFGNVPSMTDFLNQISSSIDAVITQRARLGAIQNRLERTSESIAIQIENTTNAESVIRDTDMAAETSALVRAQILAQAGTSVLNQANLLTQNVLNLLSALG